MHQSGRYPPTVLLFSLLHWILLLPAVPTAGQGPYLKQYKTADGLAYDHVNRFWQDSRGYMWIATEQGLSRFDGIDFINYFHEREDSTSLPHNQIKHIREDEQGFLWVVTSDGLSRYDPQANQFQNYRHKPGATQSMPTNELRSILVDDKAAVLWLGTLNKGLIRFDKTSGKAETYLLAPLSPFWRSANTIHWVLQDIERPNRLWLGTSRGLYSFDKEKCSFKHHPLTAKGAKRPAVKALLMEKPGELWCGTWGLGMIRYKLDDGTATAYKTLPGAGDNALVVLSILPYKGQQLLVGTYRHGLHLFDQQSGAFQAVPLSTSGHGPEGDSVINLYRDRSGAIWIATGKKGVYVLHPRLNRFQGLTPPPKPERSALKEVVITDAQYLPKTGQILATCLHQTGCGIIVYDSALSANRFLPYPGSKANEDARMYFIHRDRRGEIWTTAYGQLLKFDVENERFLPAYADLFRQLSTSPFELTTMMRDQSGHIWLGTGYGGILQIVPEADTIYHYAHQPGLPKGFYTFDIAAGPSGNIWVATNLGLLNIYPDQHRVERPHILGDRAGGGMMVVDLLTDEQGDIWCATGSEGVHVISADSAKVKQIIDRSDGLPSDITRGLAKDKNGDLWIATTGGLACLDATSSQIRAYTQVDGLRPFRCEKLDLFANGLLWLYNNDMPSYCRTEEMQIDSTLVPLAFQSIRANNETLDLSPAINFQDQVTLSYDQNLISIDFAALSYSKPQQQRYAYRLQGLSEEWQYTSGENRTATYANLQPGTYQFQLKAANDDGVWHATPRQITLIIHPPWWATTWAYLAYILAGTGLLYAIYRFQLRRRLVEEEARHLREMDAFKTRFYTNITHEFRTPITVIQGMAEQLAGNAKAKALLLRNSKQLLRLVNQMLDLSKLEEGKLPLQPVHGDVVAFLRYLTASMQSLADAKDVQLTFYAEEQTLLMAYDPDKLQQAIQNLLSNAIKFTPENGKVIFHLRTEAKHLQLVVQDTGVGIHAADLPHVFERFYQSQHGDENGATPGTGVGLALAKELVELMGGKIQVESEFGRGSRFTVQLPLETSIAATPTDEPPKEQTKLLPPADALVLIIEDNRDIIVYLQECLQGQFKVEAARNGQEGVDKALELVPDIILCDVMMPVKNGYEVSRALKQDERTSHIPIIMLTAKAIQEDRIRGLKAGVDAYLVKPFDQKELEVRLHQLLQLRQKLQQRYANGLPKTKTPSQDDQFLRKIYDFIQQEIDNDQLSVHDISHHMHLSRMQVHRKLKVLTGQSTTQLMRSIRMKKAKQLLEETDIPVAEVAYAVGYSDPNYFSRQFAVCYDITPREVRNN